MIPHKHKEKKSGKPMGQNGDRQTDRQKDRQTERQTDTKEESYSPLRLQTGRGLITAREGYSGKDKNLTMKATGNGIECWGLFSYQHQASVTIPYIFKCKTLIPYCSPAIPLGSWFVQTWISTISGRFHINFSFPGQWFSRRRFSLYNHM